MTSGIMYKICYQEIKKKKCVNAKNLREMVSKFIKIRADEDNNNIKIKTIVK